MPDEEKIYVVAWAETGAELEEKVNLLIVEGYVPIGTIVVKPFNPNAFIYTQAMVVRWFYETHLRHT